MWGILLPGAFADTKYKCGGSHRRQWKHPIVLNWKHQNWKLLNWELQEKQEQKKKSVAHARG